MKRTALKHKTAIARKTPLARGGPIKRKKPMNRRKRKNSTAVERHHDSRGIPFDTYALLPPLNGLPPRDWPTAKRVSDATVLSVMHARFDFCWECGDAHPQAHHMAAGSAGRSDEYTLVVMVCARCHGQEKESKLPLGRMLFLKWKWDRGNLDWQRTAILHGRFLPDLITGKRWST